MSNRAHFVSPLAQAAMSAVWPLTRSSSKYLTRSPYFRRSLLSSLSSPLHAASKIFRPSGVSG